MSNADNTAMIIKVIETTQGLPPWHGDPENRWTRVLMAAAWGGQHFPICPVHPGISPSELNAQIRTLEWESVDYPAWLYVDKDTIFFRAALPSRLPSCKLQDCDPAAPMYLQDDRGNGRWKLYADGPTIGTQVDSTIIAIGPDLLTQDVVVEGLWPGEPAQGLPPIVITSDQLSPALLLRTEHGLSNRICLTAAESQGLGLFEVAKIAWLHGLHFPPLRRNAEADDLPRI